MPEIKDYKLNNCQLCKLKIPKFSINKCRKESPEVLSEMLELTGEIKRNFNKDNYIKNHLEISPEFQKYGKAIKKINDLVSMSLDCDCLYLASPELDLFSQIFLFLLWIAEAEKVDFIRFKKENDLRYFVMSEVKCIPKLNVLFSNVLKCDVDLFDNLLKKLNDEYFNFYIENVSYVLKIWSETRSYRYRREHSASEIESYDRYGSLYMDILIQIAILVKEIFFDMTTGAFKKFADEFNGAIYSQALGYYDFLAKHKIYLPDFVQEHYYYYNNF